MEAQNKINGHEGMAKDMEKKMMDREGEFEKQSQLVDKLKEVLQVCVFNTL